jgi:DNA repair exonuclease SbcCD nuclease subunit
MKFLHIADCHLGGWKNEKIAGFAQAAFEKALDLAIEKNVDAVFISGDIFDVPLPSLEVIIKAMEKLKEVKARGIEIFAIAGSHDIAINLGVINLLESAEIIKNVDFRKSQDISYFFSGPLFVIGIEGKKRGREIAELEDFKNFIDRHKEAINKAECKVFLFHSSVKELIDKRLEQYIETVSIDSIPELFDYFVFGHIHANAILKKGEKFYVYPGPIFPTNFEEMESLKHGYCIVYDTESQKAEKIPLKVIDVVSMHFDASGKTPSSLSNEIVKAIEAIDKQCIATLRIEGMLNGRVSEIDFERIKKIAEEKGIIVLKNISNLKSIEAEEVELAIDASVSTIEEIERKCIESSLKKLDGRQKKHIEEIIKDIISTFDKEKLEGETNAGFEKRLLEDAKKKEKSWLAVAEIFAKDK